MFASGVYVRVSDVMTQRPVSIHKQATLAEALDLMDSHECHHLPVINSDHAVIGILTDGDCYRAMGRTFEENEWRTDRDAHRIPVSRAMTFAPVVVEPEADITKAVDLMLRHHISCVLVLRDESLVGILTTFDILYAFLRVASPS
jgi:CBS domain-containing protein